METVVLKRQIYGEPISRKTIDDIVSAIISHFKTEKIILFGSYASGRPTPDSDLDILIVMNTRLPRHQTSIPITMLFKPMPCPIDFLVFTPQEVEKWNGTVNHIITRAFQEGKILYEREQS